MTVKYTQILDSRIHQDALAIRRHVFMEEQGVSEEIEIEGEEGCYHLVLYKEDQPVATCRFYETADNVAKLQRMAVIKSSRGSGLGKELMIAAEKIAEENGFTAIILGAQNTAIGFYEKLGYHVIGAEFLDADIPHHMMEKRF